MLLRNLALRGRMFMEIHQTDPFLCRYVTKGSLDHGYRFAAVLNRRWKTNPNPAPLAPQGF
jgi:hypothetical protein